MVVVPFFEVVLLVKLLLSLQLKNDVHGFLGGAVPRGVPRGAPQPFFGHFFWGADQKHPRSAPQVSTPLFYG